MRPNKVPKRAWAEIEFDLVFLKLRFGKEWECRKPTPQQKKKTKSKKSAK